MSLPDVQSHLPDIKVDLNRAGVTGIVRYVPIKRDNSTHYARITFNIYVDVPSHRKGIDMSRIPETITETLENKVLEAQKRKFGGIEYICKDIAASILKKFNSYSKSCEVEAEAEISFIDKTPVTKKKTQRGVKLIFFIEANQNKEIEFIKKLGVESLGFSACPCAQELILADSKIDKKLLEKFPIASHNQKANILVLFNLKKHNIDIELFDVLEEIHKVVPPIFETLKRPDELETVKRAHLKPCFVEDIVRKISKKIAIRFRDLPKDVRINIRVDNAESIHNHYATAEMSQNLSKLIEQCEK